MWLLCMEEHRASWHVDIWGSGCPSTLLGRFVSDPGSRFPSIWLLSEEVGMQELHCAIALSPAFSTVGVGPGGRGIQVCRGWRACRLWACCYDLTYVDHREILLLMSLSFPSCAGTETSAWCSLAQQKTWYNKLDKTCPVCGTRAATSEVPSGLSLFRVWLLYKTGSPVPSPQSNLHTQPDAWEAQRQGAVPPFPRRHATCPGAATWREGILPCSPT